jgi:hypothetical protein
MLTRRLVVMAVSIGCAIALSTSCASAAVFLRVDPAGTALPADSLVQTHNTFHNTSFGFVGISCNLGSEFSMTVGASGGTTIFATVKTWTFRTCSGTVSGTHVTSCAQTPTVTTRVTLFLTEVLFDQLALKCSAATGACYYTAPTATGNYVGGGNLNIYLPPLGGGGGVGATLTHIPPLGAVDDLGAACGAHGNLFTALTRLTFGAGTRLTVTAS